MNFIAVDQLQQTGDCQVNENSSCRIHSPKATRALEEQPLVSVIIPAYNAEAFISQTLESVTAQTYRNLEILVVDDGSSDRTAEIVEKYEKKDSRIKLYKQSNSGVAASRNLGIQESKGEFIAPIDSDDIVYSENIEKQVECLLNEPLEIGVSYVWSIDIDQNGVPNGDFRASEISGDVYATLLCHNFLGNASSSLIRRSCFESVGLYDCQFKDNQSQGCEDWELYLRIARKYKFQVVPQFLLGYRKLPDSMSSNLYSMSKWHNLVLELTSQRGPNLPRFLYDLSRSNLYMYLARQSSAAGDSKQTLFWISQALSAEYVTPLLRYGFYRLSISSLLSLVYQTLSQRMNCEHKGSKPKSRMLRRKPTLADIENQKLNTRFKVLIWSTFHLAVSKIANLK